MIQFTCGPCENEKDKLLERIEKLRSWLSSLQSNWDHNESAHRYNNPMGCTVCVATRALEEDEAIRLQL